MPAAVAPAPHAKLPAGPMARTSQEVSPRSTYQTLAPGSQDRNVRKPSTPVIVGEQPAPQSQQHQDISPNGKGLSPNTLRPGPPKIIVKKEPPSSPEHAVPKHRPRKLDLSGSNANRLSGPATAAPNLGMQDVGIACLSPGFQTQDPAMREQLARSMSVRDQQRTLIEQRLQKNTGPGPKTGDRVAGDDQHDISGLGGLRAPPTGKKRGPPPGLSIGVPNASQFSAERVIQSAPLNQTFTGRDAPNPHALHPRQPNGGSEGMRAPPPTSNRLPPIGDVFGGMGVQHNQRTSPPPGQPGAPPTRPGLFQSHSSNTLTTQRAGAAGYPASPGFPPNSASSGQQLAPSVPPPPINQRPREYRSAEDAVAEMTQGREDLQPRLVHYGGHQPPTPPSPQPGQQGHTPTKHATYQQAPPQHAQQGYPPQQAQAPPPSAGYGPTSAAHPGPPPASAARRRPRSEYEREYGNSPPLGSGPSPRGHRGAEFAHQAAHGFGPFGAGRDSPATQRAKKEEFMACVAKAWDLWHS